MAIDEDPVLAEVISFEQLIVERDALKHDIQIIAERLAGEARSRDWCSDYERFIDDLNAELQTPWMKHVIREHTFSFIVDVTMNVDRAEVGTISEQLLEGLQNAHEFVTLDHSSGRTNVRFR
jgi:hypothetical protein